MLNVGGKWTCRKECCISQHTGYCLTVETDFFRSLATIESDKTIITVYGSLPYSSAFPNNWLRDLLDPNHGEVAQFVYPISLYIFSFHFVASLNFHAHSSASREGR